MRKVLHLCLERRVICHVVVLAKELTAVPRQTTYHDQAIDISIRSGAMNVTGELLPYNRSPRGSNSNIRNV